SVAPAAIVKTGPSPSAGAAPDDTSRPIIRTSLELGTKTMAAKVHPDPRSRRAKRRLRGPVLGRLGPYRSMAHAGALAAPRGIAFRSLRSRNRRSAHS